MLGSAAPAQVYEKIFSFTEAWIQDVAASRYKGSNPDFGLVQGRDGSFYGTVRKWYGFYDDSSRGGDDSDGVR